MAQLRVEDRPPGRGGAATAGVGASAGTSAGTSAAGGVLPPVAPAGDVIGEVFLSPRVVDREAFNDYSASLRRLIEDAAGQAEALRAAGTDAQLAREQLRDISGKTAPRIDAALRALASVEKRAEEAGTLVQTARDAARGLEQLRSQTEASLAAGLTRIEAEIERRVAEAVERLGRTERERAGALEDRARAAVEQIEAAAADVTRHLDRAALTASERALAAGAEAEAKLASVRDELDPKLDAARAQAQARLTALAGEVEARAAQVENELRESAARFDERQVVAWTCGNEMHRKLEDAVSRATALMGLRDPLETAPLPLAPQASAGGVGVTLPEALAAVARARDEAALAIAQLRSVVEQAGVARGTLGEAIVSGAEQIDQLRSMADELRTGVTRSLAEADEAGSTLGRRRAELESLLKGPLAEVTGLTDRIGEQVRAVVGQVEQSRGAAREAADAARGLIERLSALLDRIEPWRGVLLDLPPALVAGESAAGLSADGREAEHARLPAPLRAILDAVRGELAGDVARIALALEHITRKTGAVAQRLHEGPGDA